MPDIPPDEAIARARAALGRAAQEAARAWRTRRLDRPDEDYYLVNFGPDAATTAVATVDAASGEIRSTARLPGAGPHLTVEATQAVELAGLDASAATELVWRPCRASRSPLYPLWEVRTSTQTVYVDQQRRVWPALDLTGPGG
jgi:hypothetical protein